jgi:hypothetical protein
LVVADVRQWVIDHVERGAIQRIEIGVNSPVKNLSRKGPPIPDDGLNVNIVSNGVTLRPVDGLPAIRDADLKAHITGRTANVSIAQGAADTPTGRKLTVSDAVFEIADMAPKPVQSKVDRWSGAGGRRDSVLGQVERSFRNLDRSECEQRNDFCRRQPGFADQA